MTFLTVPRSRVRPEPLTMALMGTAGSFNAGKPTGRASLTREPPRLVGEQLAGAQRELPARHEPVALLQPGEAGRDRLERGAVSLAHPVDQVAHDARENDLRVRRIVALAAQVAQRERQPFLVAFQGESHRAERGDDPGQHQAQRCESLGTIALEHLLVDLLCAVLLAGGDQQRRP